MTLTVRHMSAPKRGEEPGTCEDRFGWATLAGGRIACAVADGATEATFSGMWAEALVQSFADNPPELGYSWDETMNRWLGMLRKGGTRKCPGTGSSGMDGKNQARLTGYRAGHGAGARTLPCSRTAAWRALTVGDCCAFITGQEYTLLMALPTADPEAFGNHPYLVSPNPERNLGIARQATLHSGRLYPGERTTVPIKRTRRGARVTVTHPPPVPAPHPRPKR